MWPRVLKTNCKLWGQIRFSPPAPPHQEYTNIQVEIFWENGNLFYVFKLIWIPQNHLIQLHTHTQIQIIMKYEIAHTQKASSHWIPRFKFWFFQLVNSVTLGKQLNFSAVSFSKRRKIMSNTYSENLFKNFEQCSVHSKQNTCPLYYYLPPMYFSLKIMPFTSSTTWHDLALA